MLLSEKIRESSKTVVLNRAAYVNVSAKEWADEVAALESLLETYDGNFRTVSKKCAQLEQQVERYEEALVKVDAWLDEPATPWPTQKDADEAWLLGKEVSKALAQQEE